MPPDLDLSQLSDADKDALIKALFKRLGAAERRISVLEAKHAVSSRRRRWTIRACRPRKVRRPTGVTSPKAVVHGRAAWAAKAAGVYWPATRIRQSSPGRAQARPLAQCHYGARADQSRRPAIAQTIRCRPWQLVHFPRTSDVPPDNNGSKRELRPTATYRKVTGGLRSQWGAELFANIRSVVGTAARRGTDAYHAIRDVLRDAAMLQPG
jgi:hypothetical protein